MDLQRLLHSRGLSPKINSDFVNIKRENQNVNHNLKAYYVEGMTTFNNLKNNPRNFRYYIKIYY